MIEITRFDKEKAKAAHEGTILASPVFPNCTSAPGNAYGYLDKAGARMAAHRHPTLEYYIVLEGRGYVEVDGERAEVAAGDVIQIPCNALHTMECKEDAPFVWAAFWWKV